MLFFLNIPNLKIYAKVRLKYDLVSGNTLRCRNQFWYCGSNLPGECDILFFPQIFWFNIYMHSYGLNITWCLGILCVVGTNFWYTCVAGTKFWFYRSACQGNVIYIIFSQIYQTCIYMPSYGLNMTWCLGILCVVGTNFGIMPGKCYIFSIFCNCYTLNLHLYI